MLRAIGTQKPPHEWQLDSDFEKKIFDASQAAAANEDSKVGLTSQQYNTSTSQYRYLGNQMFPAKINSEVSYILM